MFNTYILISFQVASRGVFYLSGVFLILAGIFAKVGAVLTLIPDPVLAGNMIVSFAILVSIGLSYLQFIDLTSTRNMIILGTSLFLGLTVSSWTNANPGAIQTGNIHTLKGRIGLYYYKLLLFLLLLLLLFLLFLLSLLS